MNHPTPEELNGDPNWSYGTVYLSGAIPQGPSQISETYPARVTGYLLLAMAAVQVVTFEGDSLHSDDIYPMHTILRISFHIGHPANEVQ